MHLNIFSLILALLDMKPEWSHNFTVMPWSCIHFIGGSYMLALADQIIFVFRGLFYSSWDTSADENNMVPGIFLAI